MSCSKGNQSKGKKQFQEKFCFHGSKILFSIFLFGHAFNYSSPKVITITKFISVGIDSPLTDVNIIACLNLPCFSIRLVLSNVFSLEAWFLPLPCP